MARSFAGTSWRGQSSTRSPTKMKPMKPAQAAWKRLRLSGIPWKSDRNLVGKDRLPTLNHFLKGVELSNFEGGFFGEDLGTGNRKSCKTTFWYLRMIILVRGKIWVIWRTKHVACIYTIFVIHDGSRWFNYSTVTVMTYSDYIAYSMIKTPTRSCKNSSLFQCHPKKRHRSLDHFDLHLGTTLRPRAPAQKNSWKCFIHSLWL